MKKSLFAIAALAIAASAQATSLRPTDIFKLYLEPHATLNPACDIYNKLTLDYSTGTAQVENAVVGSCDLPWIPAARVYKLEAPRTFGRTVIWIGHRAARD